MLRGAESRGGSAPDEPVECMADLGDGLSACRPGTRSTGAQLVIIAGGVLGGSLLPELRSKLRIERQVVFWFDARERYRSLRIVARSISGNTMGAASSTASRTSGMGSSSDFITMALRRPPKRYRATSSPPKWSRFGCDAPFAPGRRRAPSPSGGLPLHNTRDEHFLIDRHPVASASPGDERVLRPWLQVRPSDRRDRRGPDGRRTSRFHVGLFRWR